MTPIKGKNYIVGSLYSVHCFRDYFCEEEFAKFIKILVCKKDCLYGTNASRHVLATSQFIDAFHTYNGNYSSKTCLVIFKISSITNRVLIRLSA